MRSDELKLLVAVLCMGLCLGMASDRVNRPYDPKADAQLQIELAVAKAKSEDKTILLQIGGNWCKWCLRLDRLCRDDSSISKFIEKNYIWVHVNYSKENKNEAIMERLGHPEKLGFPVMVFLNSDGTLIHTQSTESLEDGLGHDPDKLLVLLKRWSRNGA